MWGLAADYMNRHKYKRTAKIGRHALYKINSGERYSCENCRNDPLPSELARKFWKQSSVEPPEKGFLRSEYEMAKDPAQVDILREKDVFYKFPLAHSRAQRLPSQYHQHDTLKIRRVDRHSLGPACSEALFLYVLINGCFFSFRMGCI